MFLIILQHLSVHVTAAFVLAAILKCWLYANLYRLPPSFAEDDIWSSGICRCKSIGLSEGILLPAEAVESNRSCPKYILQQNMQSQKTSKSVFNTEPNECQD